MIQRAPPGIRYCSSSLSRILIFVRTYNYERKSMLNGDGKVQGNPRHRTVIELFYKITHPYFDKLIKTHNFKLRFWNSCTLQIWSLSSYQLIVFTNHNRNCSYVLVKWGEIQLIQYIKFLHSFSHFPTKWLDEIQGPSPPRCKSLEIMKAFILVVRTLWNVHQILPTHLPVAHKRLGPSHVYT